MTLKKQHILAISLGSLIEWYDFSLFIYIAPVIAQYYFPNENANLALMHSFLIFAVGFIVRPLAAYVLGRIGDRHGRDQALKLSMACMSVGTFGMACIPSFAQIGYLAPCLLGLTRLIQGIGISGETVGSMISLAENAASQNRAKWSSLVNNIANLGVLLASLVLGICTPSNWRVAFIIGGVLSVLGLCLRQRLPKLPVQVIEAKDSQNRNAFRIIGLLSMTAIGNYLLMGYLATYLQIYIKQSAKNALHLQSLMVFSSILGIALAAILADRIKPKRALFIAAMGYLMFSFPCFNLLAEDQLWIGLSTLLICYVLEQSATPAVLVSITPAEFRYQKLGINYNLCMAIIGGSTPFVCTWLIDTFKDNRMPALYLMLGASAALISLIQKKPKLAQEMVKNS
jgi:MHS family proline/betaine transporter-like MFS transporter